MATDKPPAEQEAPKIEFPCLYPIKIIGIASVDFHILAVKAVEQHTGEIDSDLIEIMPSKANSYVSVRVTITATGVEQLGNIFEDLKKLPGLKMVL
ncbi:MAG: putative lipoic acid-binding regulatory protein [Pseudohongiellaceae bacterium]|jgi:putative lipoic acid-binding regulatory protein